MFVHAIVRIVVSINIYRQFWTPLFMFLHLQHELSIRVLKTRKSPNGIAKMVELKASDAHPGYPSKQDHLLESSHLVPAVQDEFP